MYRKHKITNVPEQTKDNPEDHHKKGIGFTIAIITRDNSLMVRAVDP